MIQTLACWSYCTIGSPSLFAWQPPPKPDHRVLMALGKPAASAPVVLAYTPKAVLTICTYCVAPTAPLVSGGAQLHGLLGVLLVSPMPLKFSPAVVPTSGPVVVCNAPSGTSGPAERAGLSSGRSGDPWNAVAADGRSRAGWDTP